MFLFYHDSASFIIILQVSAAFQFCSFASAKVCRIFCNRVANIKYPPKNFSWLSAWLASLLFEKGDVVKNSIKSYF